MTKQELDALKYELYKKSWKMDYLTFEQFKNNQNVAYTFWELKKRKSEKRVKKDLKNTKK